MPQESCVYNGDWYLLDQVLFSAVLSRSGERRGFDARSWSGVSDHLPIYFRLVLA